MSFAVLGATIRTNFEALVSTPEALPTQFNNEPFTPPAKSEWASVFMVPAPSRQASLGTSPRYRTEGSMVVQLYAPIASGSGRLLELSDTVTAGFRGKTIDGVVFRAPSARNMNRDARWWRWDVTVGFFCDEIG